MFRGGIELLTAYFTSGRMWPIVRVIDSDIDMKIESSVGHQAESPR